MKIKAEWCVVALGDRLFTAWTYASDSEHTASVQWHARPSDCLLWDQERSRRPSHVKCYDCWRSRAAWRYPSR